MEQVVLFSRFIIRLSEELNAYLLTSAKIGTTLKMRTLFFIKGRRKGRRIISR